MKLDRLLGIIIHLLNHENVSASRLAERFQISVRTIQRDIISISSAGIPVYSVNGRFGGYSILPAYRMKNIGGVFLSELQTGLGALGRRDSGGLSAARRLAAIDGTQRDHHRGNRVTSDMYEALGCLAAVMDWSPDRIKALPAASPGILLLKHSLRTLAHQQYPEKNQSARILQEDSNKYPPFQQLFFKTMNVRQSRFFKVDGCCTANHVDKRHTACVTGEIDVTGSGTTEGNIGIRICR